jgi:hypothetical protein
MTNSEGGCLCGAVRYSVTGKPVRTMNCHCRNCQRTSGSALSTIALFPKDGLSVTGLTKSYEYAGDSGGKLEINFCPECGAPIFLNILAMPQLVSVKVGSFDDPTWFEPQMDIWTSSRQPWLAGESQRLDFEHNPS